VKTGTLLLGLFSLLLQLGAFILLVFIIVRPDVVPSWMSSLMTTCVDDRMNTDGMMMMRNSEMDEMMGSGRHSMKKLMSSSDGMMMTDEDMQRMMDSGDGRPWHGMGPRWGRGMMGGPWHGFGPHGPRGGPCQGMGSHGMMGCPWHSRMMDNPEMREMMDEMMRDDVNEEHRSELREKMRKLMVENGMMTDDKEQIKTEKNGVSTPKTTAFSMNEDGKGFVVDIFKDLLVSRKDEVEGSRAQIVNGELSSTTVSSQLCYRFDSDDKFLMFLMLLGCMATSTVLILGVIKKRPGYLVPYMSVQVFAFCISCLLVFSFFSYIHVFKYHISRQPNSLPMKSYLMQMNDDHLILAVILSSVLLLVIQAYFMAVVWSCYKYLTQTRTDQSQARRRLLDEELQNPEDSELLLPPKYEDVMMSNEQSEEAQPDVLAPPPPPYVNN
jgi:hypothetical protein